MDQKLAQADYNSKIIPHHVLTIWQRILKSEIQAANIICTFKFHIFNSKLKRILLHSA